MSEVASRVATLPDIPLSERVRVTEIFYSLQGETRTVGLPTVFVRLTGCPLRCRYCDTAYAFKGGAWMTLDTVQARVAAFTPHWVTVTGGEPLAQHGTPALLSALCDRGYEVSLETSGALPVAAVDPRVIKVLDLKTPGSGEAARNDYANLQRLTPQDQVKFVIGNHADYLWAKAKLTEHGLAHTCEVLFSPSHGKLQPGQLADWILEDHLPVRLQIQLHKYLWGDMPGR